MKLAVQTQEKEHSANRGAEKTNVVDMILVFGHDKVLTQTKNSERFGTIIISPFTRSRLNGETDAVGLLETMGTYFNGVAASDAELLDVIKDGEKTFHVYRLPEKSVREVTGISQKTSFKNLKTGNMRAFFEGKAQNCLVPPVFLRAINLLSQNR